MRAGLCDRDGFKILIATSSADTVASQGLPHLALRTPRPSRSSSR